MLKVSIGLFCIVLMVGSFIGANLSFADNNQSSDNIIGKEDLDKNISPNYTLNYANLGQNKVVNAKTENLQKHKEKVKKVKHKEKVKKVKHEKVKVKKVKHEKVKAGKNKPPITVEQKNNLNKEETKNNLNKEETNNVAKEEPSSWSLWTLGGSLVLSVIIALGVLGCKKYRIYGDGPGGNIGGPGGPGGNAGGPCMQQNPVTQSILKAAIMVVGTVANSVYTRTYNAIASLFTRNQITQTEVGTILNQINTNLAIQRANITNVDVEQNITQTFIRNGTVMGIIRGTIPNNLNNITPYERTLLNIITLTNEQRIMATNLRGDLVERHANLRDLHAQIFFGIRDLRHELGLTTINYNGTLDAQEVEAVRNINPNRIPRMTQAAANNDFNMFINLLTNTLHDRNNTLTPNDAQHLHNIIIQLRDFTQYIVGADENPGFINRVNNEVDRINALLNNETRLIGAEIEDPREETKSRTKPSFKNKFGESLLDYIPPEETKDDEEYELNLAIEKSLKDNFAKREDRHEDLD